MVRFQKIDFTFNHNVEEAFTPELRQHLQHVDADLLRIIVQTGADDTEAIRCQYPTMQLVGLVLLVLLIFIPYSISASWRPPIIS